MNTIEYFYNYAENNCIDIISYPFLDIKGFFYNKNDKDYIIMNYKKIENSIDEKMVLAEECGHHFVGVEPIDIFDNSYTNYLINSKNEFRAFKWCLNKLIPLETFKRFLGTNLSKYEVARELEVSEEFLEKAYNYYINI